jgi:hypothetical protein
MKNIIFYIILIFVFAISVSAQDIEVRNADSIWRSTTEAPKDVKLIEPRVIVDYANSIYQNTLNTFPDQLKSAVSQVDSKFTINNANSTFWRTLEPINPTITDFAGTIDGTDVKLTWINKRVSEFPKVIIVYSKDTIFWHPTDENEYQEGKEAVADLVVGFIGEGTSITIKGLQPETIYNFAIFGYNNIALEYSIGSYTSIKTDPMKGIKGDVNRDGQIRSNDAILTLRISVNLMVPSSEEFWSADMNNDGKVMANDAILILRKASGLGAPDVFVKAHQMIEVTLAEFHALAGESIVAPVKANNTDVLSGGDICIMYDSKVLRAVDISSDPDVLMVSNITVPGEVRIAFADIDKITDDTLAKIRFEVLSDSTSPLRFQRAEFYCFDGLPIDSRKVDGKFTSWAMPPEQSELFQNYPNPFNPETWIPFQLHEDCPVTVNIYDASGRLVRKLGLGKKDAGVYIARDRAAYWDGRNESGEEVSSGVYFYQIQAGKFTSTKKLLLMK